MKAVSEKLQKLQQIAGAKFKEKVGIIKDYDNIFDTQVDAWHRRVEEVSSNSLFNAMQHNHVPVDFVYLTDVSEYEDLKQYEVLFYPHATILTKEIV